MNALHDPDAIVVGSGAGGAAAAFGLVNRGLRVCLVEKGERLPMDGTTLDVQRVVHDGAFLSRETWRDHGGARLQPEERFNVGGKTRWYGAALLRFGSDEWGADPAWGTRGWPLPREALEPYYAQAERLLGVRDIPAEAGLARIEQDLLPSGWRGAALPMALSPRIGDDLHEAMHFDGFASVARLKGDAASAFIDPIAGTDRFTLLTGCEVVGLLGDGGPDPRVRGVRLADGRELHAPHVLLAAGALHSPRLLQRFLDTVGLAPALGAQAGRGLKLHHLTAMVAMSTGKQADVLRKTRIFTHPAYPHSTVQPLGFDAELIASLVPRILPRPVARWLGTRAYGFFLQTEDATHAANRVYEASGGERILDYDSARVPVSAREHRAMTRGFQSALLRAGFISFTKAIGLAGTAHACGTLAAGSDPGASAVDPVGRVHGVAGLYVADGSVMPRSGRVNPSLSIFAWGLRLADQLADAIDAARARATAP